jgi:acylphosphatase
MMVRAHVLASGRVQGVCFRTETENMAKRLQVVGWVRNLLDGRVEAVFEGEEHGVELAVEFCKRGPPGAYVRDLVVTWEDWTGQFHDFHITSGRS